MACFMTIFSFQQLVDDIAEILHFGGSGDGEGDIIHSVPTERRVRVLLAM